MPPEEPQISLEEPVVDQNGEGVEPALNGHPPQPRQAPTVAFDKAVDNILKLGSHDLKMEGETLVVVDRALKKKQNRTCGFAPASDPASSRSIPLYNIIWVTLSEDAATLTIDFAESVSKSRTRAAQLVIQVGPSPDLPAGALEAWTDTLLSRSYASAPRCRRAYVLVNPHAGPGGADKKWELQVKPLFDAARMHLTVVTTEYSGHAVELVQALDADAYDIVVACSGDGLAHEIFNGLGKRPDARTALAKLAVCHIPCGSGNAMACNLYGTNKPSLAALAIVKGQVTPMDLVSVTQGPRRTLSFLSQAVGIVAEADLATENLRWMGDGRFTWGFLQRFMARKVYPCDLAVKVEIEHKDGVRGHYSRVRSGSKEALTIGSVGGTSEATSANEDGLPPLKYGTINDKLPEGWELVPYDKLGNFYCGNMAYMAADSVFFSASLINDGLMDLITIDGNIPIAKSFGMFLNIETLFDNPLVQYRKITGFRLIPKNQKDGYISIDGERIPFEPFQAEIHQGLATVLTLAGKYENAGPRDWDKVHTMERLIA